MNEEETTVEEVETKVSDKELFQQEFKALLEKYNVGIVFSVEERSDTYGIYGEKMVVYHQPADSFNTENWIEVDGWSINKSDV